MQHRMRHNLARVGVTLFVAAAFGPAVASRADLLRPDAAQTFPDLAGDIAGAQDYTYNSATQTGTFVVNNAPSLIAVDARVSGESYVYDPPGQPRSETIQVKLDSGGNLVNDPGNTFSVYGSVTIGGKSFSGLLLQGTPTGFGWAATNSATPNVSNFDLNVNLTGGLLKPEYGADAYIRVTSDLGRHFTGDFTTSFLGQNATTDVKAYDPPRPRPVPEPSTFAIILACGGAGLLYHQRRRIEVAALTAED